MKRFFYAICAVAMAFILTACPKKDPVNFDDLVEDGVYVYGDATGFDKVGDVLRMANGINEKKDQTLRDGMFEKYIVLEGGKDFSLVWVTGGEQVLYGATLAEFTPAELTGIYEDNPATAILKGKLEIGENAPKMKVAKTGLYHIVLDLNKNNDLDNALILVAPANFGVRGGMNGWGFTEMAATTPSNDGMTFSIDNAELVNGLEFKFAYGGAWKITLDSEGEIKANTNLGQNSMPGGDNFVVEKPGEYNISLTFKLAAGDLKNSFSYKIDLAKEVEITAPEHMYMIGNQWGGWDWNSEGIVELSGIPSAPGYFWCTRYFNAADGFKFCALKEWSGDFTGEGTVGYTIHDGNCWVEEDGFYTVFVNGNDKVVEIMPAEVYGIGDAWGADAWDFNAPDVVKFEADGKVFKATTTANSAAVRLASKVTPSAPIEGVTTGNGWIDWWKTEFVYFDGKIAYRGAGNDQERVAVEEGKEIVIDFNAGTVTVGSPVADAITIDGDFSDWAGIEGATGESVSAALKATSDANNLYFYYERNATRMADLWDGAGYVYLCFDTDNDPSTGVELWGNGPFESLCVIYPYAAQAIAIANEGAAVPDGCTVANARVAGAFDDNGIAVEIAIPRNDLIAMPETPITVWMWSNKGGTKISVSCTL